jgi:hypothetical protein
LRRKTVSCIFRIYETLQPRSAELIVIAKSPTRRQSARVSQKALLHAPPQVVLVSFGFVDFDQSALR